MARLSEDERLRAIGMLQTGMFQKEVARRFGVHRNSVSALWRRFQHGNTSEVPRSGRPRVTSIRLDNHIRLIHLRNRFQPAALTARTIPGLRPIRSRTVRNRLCEHNIHPRRPAIRPVLLQRHRQPRLQWCRQHLRFRRVDWNNVLFSDESRFHLNSSDGRARVYRRIGERYADPCIVQRQHFGGGSVMVWGGISFRGRTKLVVVRGNSKGRTLQRRDYPAPCIAVCSRRRTSYDVST